MASGASFRLIVRRGPQPNQVYELTKDVVTIGRDITNDIVVSDPEVSRHHTRLSRTASGYAVEDLGSTNGSFVNGQRVSGSPRALSNGDLVGIGETVTLAYEAVGVVSQADPTVMQSGPPAAAPAPRPAPAPAPPAAPRSAPPMADEDEAEPQMNRTLIIGGAAAVVLCCCLVVAALLITGAWCDWVPGAADIPMLCAP